MSASLTAQPESFGQARQGSVEQKCKNIKNARWGYMKIKLKSVCISKGILLEASTQLRNKKKKRFFLIFTCFGLIAAYLIYGRTLKTPEIQKKEVDKLEPFQLILNHLDSSDSSSVEQRFALVKANRPTTHWGIQKCSNILKIYSNEDSPGMWLRSVL